MSWERHNVKRAQKILGYKMHSHAPFFYLKQRSHLAVVIVGREEVDIQGTRLGKLKWSAILLERDDESWCQITEIEHAYSSNLGTTKKAAANYLDHYLIGYLEKRFKQW